MKTIVYTSLFLLSACALCGCGKEASDESKLHNSALRIKNSRTSDEKTAALHSAIDVSSGVLKKSSDNYKAKLLLAVAYEKQGKYDEALDLANQAAQENPDNFVALYTCGRLAAEHPLRRQQAFSLLQKALALKPDDTDTLILLCSLGTQLNHPQTIEYLSRLQQNKKYAGSATLSYQFAICFANQNKKRAAYSFFKQAVSKGINNPTLIYNSAVRIDRGKLGDPRSFYILYLNAPGKKSAVHTDHAKKRVRELGGR